MTYVLLCNYTSSLSNNNGLWPSSFQCRTNQIAELPAKGFHTTHSFWRVEWGMKSAWGHSRLGQGDWTIVSHAVCCGNSTNPRPTLIPNCCFRNGGAVRMTPVKKLHNSGSWSSSSVETTLWKITSWTCSLLFILALTVGLCCWLVYDKTMQGSWWVKNSIKQTNTIQM